MFGRKMFVDNLWTNDALKLEQDVIRQLKPLMEHWLDLGYEPHEISHMFIIAAMNIELETRMDLRMKKKSKNRARR